MSGTHGHLVGRRKVTTVSAPPVKDAIHVELPGVLFDAGRFTYQYTYQIG